MQGYPYDMCTSLSNLAERLASANRDELGFINFLYLNLIIRMVSLLIKLNHGLSIGPKPNEINKGLK